MIATGKNGISATMLLDSVSEEGMRLQTFELVYNRAVHSELMTHRCFSRNAASSRAIPFDKMKEQLTAVPVRFGAANRGMQDTGEEFIADVYGISHEHAWDEAKKDALHWATAFYEAGYHKQIYNRLTEPFQMIKTIVTSTEMDNFFWLRNDTAADPTLQELARVMLEVSDNSEPTLLRCGEWHLPYVDTTYNDDTDALIYHIGERQGSELTILTLEDAIKVSSARCAAVSFRNEDYDLQKSIAVYERLVGDERKHSSAMEHQATPMMPETIQYCKNGQVLLNNAAFSFSWQEGVSHADREGNLWSGNFQGWIQHRKLINGENHNY